MIQCSIDAIVLLECFIEEISRTYVAKEESHYRESLAFATKYKYFSALLFKY